MALFSWFNSASQVDTALVLVAIVGAVVEVVVAVSAVINVHKEIEESRKKKLEKYIEIFACIAAFLFLAEAILGCRSSMLLAKDIEGLHKANLELQAKLQPRTITPKQIKDFIFLTSKLPKLPIAIWVGGLNDEAFNYAAQVRDMLNVATFPVPDADKEFPAGVHVNPYLLTWKNSFPSNWPDVTFMKGYTNAIRQIQFRYEFTNGMTRPIVFEEEPDETNKTIAAISFVFGQIGITQNESYAPDWAGNNGNIIFVKQRGL